MAMHIIKLINHPKRKHESRDENSYVHDLMRGAKHVKASRTPPLGKLFRQLCHPKHSGKGFFTLEAYAAAPRVLNSSVIKIQNKDILRDCNS